MKLLIFGHACSPRAGSEPGFTWNWAWHLSRQHDVFVLAYPHDRACVEGFLSQHPNEHLRFFWVDLPGSEATCPTDCGLQDPSLYLLWQRLAYKKVLELHEQFGFDLVHHISYGSVSAPPPVHKLDLPFVWGPVGGGQLTPPSFRHYFGRAWTRELLRSMRVRLLRFSPFARSAAKASLVTFVTNQETAALLRRMGARDVRLCLDSGIPSHFVSDRDVSSRNREPFTLLWVGRMQPRKALPLALEALARTNGLRVRLLIAGDGEMRKPWEEYAQRLRLQHKVEFLGKVPWDRMPGLYQQADAFLFTSLRDSFGTQVLEAMGHGLPILTLDHQGVATFVPTGAGIKVRVTTPRETVLGIANGIRRLARNPDQRRRMGEAGRAFARTQTWEKRADRMSKLYEEVLNVRASARLGTPASYGSHGVKKRIEKIDEMLDLRGKSVLDLGCGNGCYTAELARQAASVCGVDIQRQHLKAFRQPLPRVQAAGETLPFASESFDVVTMIEVLEHTNRDGAVLKECFRVLKPGGCALLFVPNKLYPFESHPCHIGNLPIGPNIPLVSWLPEFVRRHLCHARIYTRRGLLSLAESAGFQLFKGSYIFPPLDSFRLPFKDFYRRLARKLENSRAARFGVSLCVVLQKPAVPQTSEAAVQISPSSVPAENTCFDVLGVRVHAAQTQDVVARMEKWIQAGDRCRTIAATSMHGIVEAQHDPSFKEILNATDAIVPDGMPLVWLGRRRGHNLPRRVYGPDLMLDFCEKTAQRGYRHFFYGGEPGVAERLAESLTRRFPSLQVCGTFSPPFRPLNPKEDEEIVEFICRATPDVLWVGLGAPKQERWMHEHRDKLQVPVVASVGAAFDFLSGRRMQAPLWMREHGLEWLFRLLQEPRRLWRRYLIYGAQFLFYLWQDSVGRKDFAVSRRETLPPSFS
jgi:exopolysaccharide biosynthesis WecB/TagA/CpsF family protein